MKKNVIVISTILLGIIALIAGWFIYQSLTTEETPNTPFEDETSPFFPSGTGGSGSPIDIPIGGFEDGGVGQGFFAPRFRLLHDTPVASGTFKNTGSTTVRFIEKETGHIFETALDSRQSVRLTNTTIPHIQKAFWGNQASSTVLQYIEDDGDTIQTFVGTITIDEDTTLGELTGSFLEENISFVTTAPNTESFFYLENTSNESTGNIYSFDTNTTEEVFSTPLIEIKPQWATDRTLLLTTLPSRDTFGYMYQTSTNGAPLRKVFGPVSGLTTLSNPTFSHVLFSQNGSLSLYNVTTESLQQTGITTLPDKCVWANTETTVAYCAVPKNPPSDAFPDRWYQGRISTTDAIWKINAAEGSSDLFFDLESEGVSVDIDSLVLDQTDSHLLLHTKDTNGLYLLRIEE